jgi:hypothetical protein
MQVGTRVRPHWGRQRLVQCPVDLVNRFCVGIGGLPGVAEGGPLRDFV